MDDSLICIRCGRGCSDPCEALSMLMARYQELRTKEKTQLIRELRKELNIIDYEVSDELKELGEQVIRKMPELSHILNFDIKIGYVMSYESKREKGKTIFADCRKVKGAYTAYLPFDFVITFYEPNIDQMSINQKKIIMLHELRHIGIGPRGLKIEDHDVEDFRDILHRFGIEWNGFDQDVPDILAGGDNVKGKGKKK